MSRLTSTALALVSVLVLGACVTVSPAGSSAPTARPPTNSADPVVSTQAPGQPTAPAPTPAGQPEGNLCGILSLEEVSAAAGGLSARVQDGGDYEGQCTWDVGQSDLYPELPAGDLQLRRDFADAYVQQRELFPNGEDIAVGDEGYWTPELNVLYFLKNGTDFAVQVVSYDSDQVDERTLAVAIAQAAAPRL